MLSIKFIALQYIAPYHENTVDNNIVSSSRLNVSSVYFCDLKIIIKQNVLIIIPSLSEDPISPLDYMFLILKKNKGIYSNYTSSFHIQIIIRLHVLNL